MEFTGGQSPFYESSGYFGQSDSSKHSTVWKDYLRHHKTGSFSMSKPSALGSFFQNDATVMAKHQLCQDSLGEGLCLGCKIDDWACHCKDLFQCVGDMTDYDLAVLVAGGFTNTTP